MSITYIVDGGVIIWTDKGGKPFNDIKKADKYFDTQLKAGKNPCWTRVFKKVTDEAVAKAKG